MKDLLKQNKLQETSEEQYKDLLLDDEEIPQLSLEDLQKKYKDLIDTMKELVEDKDKLLEGVPQNYDDLLLDDK